MPELQVTPGSRYDTSKLETQGMGMAVDAMVNTAKSGRRKFERRWYDNNFFDDGYHFRFLSRSQNKIIDLSDRATLYAPMRAIPKASRQIRGVSNLLSSNDLVPVVYPERVNKAAYPDTSQVDPQTGQPTTTPNPEFEKAQEIAKRIAKLSGHWVSEEFKNQELTTKLIFMIILAAKHGVSYLQIWPDAEAESIKTAVRDAFDVYLVGEMTEIEDQPFVVLAHPKSVAEIKANELFDINQRAKINPDNLLASSEIKEAYLKTRFARDYRDDSSATLILKEAYIKERLNDQNRPRIQKQENAGEILADRKPGDCVIRQVFVAGNIWLKDEYIALPHYPFVDFRFEPGPMYPVPLIERFIPSNKSLDQIVSRIERFAHLMTVGAYMKRQGEQVNFSNTAGGQVVEYKSVPPQQLQLASIPPYIFNFVGLLNSFIEEQGTSTSTLGQIPQGVKAYKAIEALKESEYANLVTANRMLKKTVKIIAERMLDYADNYFVTPQEVMYLEKGEPQYFDIIGKNALKEREKLKVPVGEGVVPISKEYRVDIEVQGGMAYTQEGKKAAAKDLGDYMIQLAQLGLLPPQAVNQFLEVMLKQYQFGPTDEVMEAMEGWQTQGMVNEQQMNKIKVGLAEVIKDTGVADQNHEQDIQKMKIAVAEVIKELGLADKASQEPKPTKDVPSRSISFKDLPPKGKVQLAGQAGIDISADEVESQDATQVKGGGQQ